jgi:hypothetical protein
MKMEQTECSEMLAYKIQTPGNYPEENIQQSVLFMYHTTHGICNKENGGVYATCFESH